MFPALILEKAGDTGLLMIDTPLTLFSSPLTCIYPVDWHSGLSWLVQVDYTFISTIPSAGIAVLIIYMLHLGSVWCSNEQLGVAHISMNLVTANAEQVSKDCYHTTLI